MCPVSSARNQTFLVQGLFWAAPTERNSARRRHGANSGARRWSAASRRADTAALCNGLKYFASR